MKPKALFEGNINTIYKLDRSGEKNTITNIKNERGNITAYSKNIKG